jgi:hypothetical protein
MVGSAEPMELYGFDVDWANIPASFGEDSFNIGPGGDNDAQHKVAHPQNDSCVTKPTCHSLMPLLRCQIVVDFATDPNVTALQASFTDEFFDTFDSGVRVRSVVWLCV